jgi:hypothetical protein
MHQRGDLARTGGGLVCLCGAGVKGVVIVQMAAHDQLDLRGGARQMVSQLEQAVRIAAQVIVDDDAMARGKGASGHGGLRHTGYSGAGGHHVAAGQKGGKLGSGHDASFSQTHRACPCHVTDGYSVQSTGAAA